MKEGQLDVNQKLMVALLRTNAHFTSILADFGDEMLALLEYGGDEDREALAKRLTEVTSAVNEFLRLFSPDNPVAAVLEGGGLGRA